MATLEQVEKLRQRANVSYDEAKAALDATNGDLLEAIIYLEKQGRVKSPSGSGFYSSEQKSGESENKEKTSAPKNGETFSDIMRRFGRFLLNVIRKCNQNSFEIVRGNEVKGSIPVTVLVLLLLFAFWITLPLMIIGLFFNLHYRFVGPDLGKDAVNNAMESASKAAEDIKKSIQS